MYPYNNEENIKLVAAAEESLPEPLGETSRVAVLIEEAIKDEITDSIYYMEMAEKEEDSFIKELYENMSDDETRHSTLLKGIYKEMTGIIAPETAVEKRPLGDNLYDEAKKDAISELKGAAFYRDLISVIENPEEAYEINLIMNDEQNHALLNTLIMEMRK